MMPPVLSVIIVHFDTEELLEKCLQSIFEYPCLVSFEVIVADNGSEAERMKAIQNRFRPANFLKMGSNVGFSKAVNCAIEQSKGDYLLVLNPDVQLLPSSIDLMLHYLKHHPVVGAVGPKHLSSGGKIQFTWGRFPSLTSELFRKALHTWKNNSIANRFIDNFTRVTQKVDWVSGSCILIRKSVLEKAGLLDDRFFLYFEDIDWCKRIKDAGFEIHYLPDIPIHHIGGASANRHQIDAREAYRQSQFYFFYKHYGSNYSKGIRTGIAIKSLGLLGFHLFWWLLSSTEKQAQQEWIRAMIQNKILKTAFRFNPGETA